MHNKIAFCLIASLLLFASGCTLDEVKDKGDLCPGDKSSGAQLSYIVTQDEEKCDAESCPEYAESFEIGVCPATLSACHVDPEKQYYCSTPCTKSMIACMGKCINPKENSKFCGARGECNDPDESSDDFIGNTCSNGKKCDNGVCTDEVCNGLTCDGKCINPSTSAEFCGAKGRCLDENSDSEDFIGINCGEHAICSNGECKCDDNYIRCDGKCVNFLSNPNYCGAKGECTSDDPDDDNYRGETCESGNVCDLGECKVQTCEGNERVCDTEEGRKCINTMTNIDHCGSCGHSCNENHPENQIAYACIDGTCSYLCTKEYENCAKEEGGIQCVSKENMKTDSLNCGECGKVCTEGTRCVDGQCIESSCESNQCAINGKCENTDTACGPNCLNCSASGNAAQGTCNNGTCIVSKCQQGYHLKFDATGVVCSQNTNTECGKQDSTTVTDCTTGNYTGKCMNDGTCEEINCPSGCPLNGQCLNDDEHCGQSCQNCVGLGGAASAKCENNQCVIKVCPNNSHISEDGKSCVANSAASCAPTDSKFPQNCNTIDSNGNWTCSNGYCLLTGCKSGFHQYGNNCEANNNQNCGSHGNACPNNYSCQGTSCTLTSCDDSVENESCGFEKVCKTTGATGGSNIQCVSFSDRDNECFYDKTPKKCPGRTGTTGTCIYKPSLASKYVGRSQRWTCECSNTSYVFCLSNNTYQCVNPAKCTYVY